jgi:hypothetical protein
MIGPDCGGGCCGQELRDRIGKAQRVLLGKISGRNVQNYLAYLVLAGPQ